MDERKAQETSKRTPSLDGVERLQVSPFEILLDPNSFRLIEDPLWEQIPDESIPGEEQQRRTFETLLSGFPGLHDLRESMSKHDWLDIEPLWVRRTSSGALVVVDGNRRLAAWRSRFGPSGPQAILPFDPTATTITVHVLSDPFSRVASLALGVRHLLVTEPWPALATAVWREEYNQNFGEWPETSTRRRRPDVDLPALILARQFKRGPWGSQYKPSVYHLIREALSNRRIAEWLRMKGRGQADEERLGRFFSWLMPKDQEGSGLEDPIPGDYEVGGDSPPSRPAIASPMDIRQLGLVLDRADVLAHLDAGGRLDKIDVARPFIAVEEPENHLHPALTALLTRSLPINPSRAQQAIRQLREAVLRANEQPVEPGTDHPWALADPLTPVYLRSVTLTRFRGLSNLQLTDLGRINVVVGVNNAGKTSILEAIYILARLSDPRGLLDTLQVRTRQDPERNPSWLSELIDGLRIDLSTNTSDGRRVKLRLGRLLAQAGVDLATHIPGLRFDAEVDGVRHTTETELFSNRSRRTVQKEGESVWLSPAVLHSPFTRKDRNALIQWYEASVEQGVLGSILDTIRAAIDPGVEDIRLVSETGRFIVTHAARDPMDLISYGEGFQRVFEIGLLFAAHRGGLVLIDEVETAIHTNALLGFARMLHEFAARFDVQAFISTHSKETLDAFLLNEFSPKDVVAYVLRRFENAKIVAQRFAGPALKRAVEVGDVDLRRL